MRRECTQRYTQCHMGCPSTVRACRYSAEPHEKTHPVTAFLSPWECPLLEYQTTART